MKWKDPQRFEDGAMREKLVFAWFPVRCEDGFVRWLETIRIVEKYGYYGYNEDATWGWQTLKAYQAEFEGKAHPLR